MKIQHNIKAQNAYRHHKKNATSLSKNLEKLSSGYRINRAVDDAAGLAVSEKMRLQITGLDRALDNAKEGINLVKTAEGALQEIQDMLRRCKYLATQSANGTYSNLERQALDDEFQQLKTEIDRIGECCDKFAAAIRVVGVIHAVDSDKDIGTPEGLSPRGSERKKDQVARRNIGHRNTDRLLMGNIHIRCQG